MKKCVRNLVFVFDLDKTLGYFTQVAIFIEGVEHYIGRKLKKNEVYKIFDLFPEMFRPDTMNILKYLKQLKHKLKIEYYIKGMKDGKHGFHVHQIGNFKGDCKKAGSHFNPDKFTHGSRTSHKRHAGDLGNILSKNKIAKGKFTDNRLSLRKNSKYFIGNRSIIVHDLKDDLGKGGDQESLKTGNAGPRLNCAKIKLI